MKINENQKVTLTLGQLKRLVKEAEALQVASPDTPSIQPKIDGTPADVLNQRMREHGGWVSSTGGALVAARHTDPNNEYVYDPHVGQSEEHFNWTKQNPYIGVDGSRKASEIRNDPELTKKYEEWKANEPDYYRSDYVQPFPVCQSPATSPMTGSPATSPTMSENQKVTLTLGQIKRLLKEYQVGTYDMTDSRKEDDDPRLSELKKAIRNITGFFPNNVTIADDGFTCGDIRFKVDASEPIPWRAISVEPITIEGPLGDQIAGYVVSRFITADKSSVQRIVDLFK